MNDLTVFYPPIKTQIEINKFKIVDVKINLFESASFTVLLYNVDDKMINSKFYKLTTEEYVQWYNDDLFLVKWVKNKLSVEAQNL